MTCVRRLIYLCLILLSMQLSAWDDRRLATPVVIDNFIIPYPTFALYYAPGTRFTVNFKDSRYGGLVRFNGEEVAVGSQQLITPEKPGLYTLEIENSRGGETAVINIFVTVPASQVDGKGYLNGYRIGSYPVKPLRGNTIYLPPKGYVEVTRENANTRVSPNFTLGQFVAKQAQGYPKYVVLRPRLLVKLESILEALNHNGRQTDGLVIMSGYRTPWYNRSIGNVAYSRHAWGGAADMYIDENPKDGVMDDFNGDGVVNRKDAVDLAGFIDDLSRQNKFGDGIGGLGIYGSNSAHGPFVHVDVRGARARW